MLERWFEARRVRPSIVGEFNDRALLNAFGQAGTGIFVMPEPIERAVCRQYRVHVLGRVDAVREHF